MIIEERYMISKFSSGTKMYFFGVFYLLSTSLEGVVSSFQIGLSLPSVAETDPKINQSRCNLQFSICRHAGGKVLSLENHHSLF